MAYLCFYSAEGRGEGGKKVKQYLQLSCFQKGKRNRVHEKMRAEESERGRGRDPPPGTLPPRGRRLQRDARRRAPCLEVWGAQGPGAQRGRAGARGWPCRGRPSPLNQPQHKPLPARGRETRASAALLRPALPAWVLAEQRSVRCGELRPRTRRAWKAAEHAGRWWMSVCLPLHAVCALRASQVARAAAPGCVCHRAHGAAPARPRCRVCAHPLRWVLAVSSSTWMGSRGQGEKKMVSPADQEKAQQKARQN